MPRPRLSVRILLLAVATVAVGLGLVEEGARRERRAVRWADARDGRLVYLDQLDAAGKLLKGSRPTAPTWLRRRLGDEYFRRIAWVELGEVRDPFPPEELEVLVALPELRRLVMRGPAVEDGHLAWVGRMSRLEDLDVTRGRITDAGLEDLAGLRRLKRLDLSGTQVKGPGLASLAGLQQIESLDLKWAPVTDFGMASLPTWPMLEALTLGPDLSDVSLDRLVRYPRLKGLMLINTRVTGAGLRARLPRMKRLKFLGVHDARVKGDEEMSRLVRDYPNMEISLSY